MRRNTITRPTQLARQQSALQCLKGKALKAKTLSEKSMKKVCPPAAGAAEPDEAAEPRTAKSFWGMASAAHLPSRQPSLARWGQLIADASRDHSIVKHRLEHNHSHFLLVDDAEKKLERGATGADLAWYELQTRRNLEHAIYTTDLAGDGVTAPMLTMLVGGDAATLQLALSRLQQGLPVLVIADSGGGAADLRNWVLHGCLATEDPSPEYSAKAEEIIPQILAYGQELGENTTPRLSFLELDVESIDIEVEVDFTLMQARIVDEGG